MLIQLQTQTHLHNTYSLQTIHNIYVCIKCYNTPWWTRESSKSEENLNKYLTYLLAESNKESIIAFTKMLSLSWCVGITHCTFFLKCLKKLWPVAEEKGDKPDWTKGDKNTKWEDQLVSVNPWVWRMQWRWQKCDWKISFVLRK